jgi:type I restriction enzyme R subunit
VRREPNIGGSSHAEFAGLRHGWQAQAVAQTNPRRGPREADTCRDYLLPRLRDAGWRDDQIIEEHYFTDGRIVPTIRGHRREPGKRADYLLEIEPGFPVAVVEAKRLYRLPSDGLQQGMRYAEILNLPFVYASNGAGIVEHDYDSGRQRVLDAFPSPGELRARYYAWQGLTAEVADELMLPFNRDLRRPDGGVKEPRYYQAIAINRAVQAALGGDKRILLTLATGTGKTFVALQVVWKLWSSNWQGTRKPRVLYLADRNILVDQPITREFVPVFGRDAVWKLQGAAKTGREIFFALYQAIGDVAGAEAGGIFRDYPSDYFDLIVVDECHRGSARDESSWRAILEHFSSATQLGMTATPLRDDNVDSYRYFGNPLYEYSLAQGIDDGFLAPYRVRRVVLSPDAEGWEPSGEQLDLFGREIPAGTYTTQQFERVVSLLMRTRAAARHLTDYLKASDRFAKTIVFCVDSEHAEQMRLALHEANADLTRQYPHYVARIVSAEGDVGRELLDDFIDAEKQTPVIVTTSKLLSTGVDIPTCRNVVLFKPIGSIVDFKQIIGRGTRLFPDQDKLSFTILDYSGATALFADPEFDGVPEQIVEEVVTEDGQTRLEEVTTEVVPVNAEGDAELEEIGERARKYYIDEGEAYVTAEAVYLLVGNEQSLQVVEYEDYVAAQLRRLYPAAGDLRSLWRTAGGRDQVVAELDARGITLAELAERTGLVDADPFDLLVHIAWNGALTSRRDRAAALTRDHREFFARFQPEAREILEQLLDKYADHGLDQLDDLHVLELPPLSAFGTPVEIAARFGGAPHLREAVDELEALLYAA